MSIKKYIIKIWFAIILACVYLTLALISSRIINTLMYKLYVKFNKKNTINLIIRIYLRTALIIIFIYIIRSAIKYTVPYTIYLFDINNKKQIDRNIIILSYGLFLLQPEYAKDIKTLFNINL
jgi:hypothetical protein